ncbi:DHH family phosphoesterase [Apilactobacillus ozensis]|uniref:DHH family phosphoesterase n=1 Tax=Apilactobacillus ozensis TaxID=866801 RepID=UPI0006D1F69B|nr:DHH family phosphoesterase [Apilactobacillus ozensis]
MKKITIYGDYDADGITSTAILYETLQNMGAKVSFYIPNRFTDGYGPNSDAYKKLLMTERL